MVLVGEYSKLALEELLLHYKNAELLAFDELYLRTSKLLYNFIRKRLRFKDDAEDAFQESYFRIHKYIATYNPDQPAMAWIFAITRNVIVDRLKLNSKMQTSSIGDIEVVCAKESAESILIFNDLLNEVLRDLNESDKRLLVDRVLNEMDYEEISVHHSVSVTNARQKVSRILKNVRFRFEKL